MRTIKGISWRLNSDLSLSPILMIDGMDPVLGLSTEYIRQHNITIGCTVEIGMGYIKVIQPGEVFSYPAFIIVIDNKISAFITKEGNRKPVSDLQFSTALDIMQYIDPEATEAVFWFEKEYWFPESALVDRVPALVNTYVSEVKNLIDNMDLVSLCNEHIKDFMSRNPTFYKSPDKSTILEELDHIVLDFHNEILHTMLAKHRDIKLVCEKELNS